MEWSEQLIDETLRKMRTSERIPEPERRQAARERLLAYSAPDLYTLETRLGWIGLVRSPYGIRHLQLPRSSRAAALHDLEEEFPGGVPREDVPDSLARELRDYAEGRCRKFNLSLDLAEVKPFQRAVLTAISRIPFGETRTYGWVAREIGRPQAARAVGQALHRNPIPIVIPCHRVVASNGNLGGYGGGLPMKVKLLQLEGVSLP